MKAVIYPTDQAARISLKQKYVAALSVLKNKNGKNKLEQAQKEWRKIIDYYGKARINTKNSTESS